MNTAALSLHHVTRSFAARKAVNDLSFAIRAGEVVCLLGPNGAGKTTTVKMCSTLLRPDSGSIHVGDIDAIAYPRAARRASGLVLGGNSGFYSRATGRRNLLFFADVAGVAGRDRRERVESALEAVNLTDRASDAVSTYSRGMTQRLHIARALLNRPSLLLLDEPTSGLDPEIAAEVRGLIKDLKMSGTGILLTSHYMAEVEELADDIRVIVSGSQVADGSVRDISTRSGVTHVTTFSTDVRPTALDSVLGPSASAIAVSEANGRWTVSIPWKSGVELDRVHTWLESMRREAPLDLVSRPATLEESYLALVRSVA